MEDIGVKGLEAVGDSLLHIGIYCISRSSRVLLKRSKKMQTAGQDGAVSRLVQQQSLTN